MKRSTVYLLVGILSAIIITVFALKINQIENSNNDVPALEDSIEIKVLDDTMLEVSLGDTVFENERMENESLEVESKCGEDVKAEEKCG